MIENVFDIVNIINSNKKHKEDLVEDSDLQKHYLPYIINRNFAKYPDTLYFAQEMNLNHHLEPRLQFSFLINTIRPGMRFDKKIEKVENENSALISEYFGFNPKKTRAALSILSDNQISMIKEETEKGGQLCH